MNFDELSKPLDVEDIEFRIGNTWEGKAFSLLAYKTARTDVKRLNDVCGSLWKNEYFYDDKGLLTCAISIYNADIKEWITRVDVGTESYTEKEKGSYSDAFKRAGFKWGIGAELYNFPFMYIPWTDWSGKNPKFYTSELRLINYPDSITLEYKGKNIFKFDKFKTASKSTDADKKQYWDEFIEHCNRFNVDTLDFLDWLGVDRTDKQAFSNTVIQFLRQEEHFTDQINNYLGSLNSSGGAR